MMDLLWGAAVLVLLGTGAFLVSVWAYRMGYARARLRARAIVTATASSKMPMDPMPARRAWALCCERILDRLDNL